MDVTICADTFSIQKTICTDEAENRGLVMRAQESFHWYAWLFVD